MKISYTLSLSLLFLMLASPSYGRSFNSGWCNWFPWICSPEPEPEPEPEPVFDLDVLEVTSNGSGCPGHQGDVEIVDNDHISINTPDMFAEGGEGISMQDARKNCQYTIELAYPADWTFAVSSVTIKGSVDLDANMSALQKVSSYFQGSENTKTLEKSFKGALSLNYEESLDFLPTTLEYAPCGVKRALNINSSISISGRTAYGSLSTEPNNEITLIWKQCN